MKPSRLPDPGEAPAQEAGKLKEEIEIDIEDDIPEEDEMPPEFIDINQDGKPDEEEEELSPQEEFGTGLEDHDITGRNFAYEAYKKVEKVILDGYDLVADSPKDSKIFYDYLLTGKRPKDQKNNRNRILDDSAGRCICGLHKWNYCFI